MMAEKIDPVNGALGLENLSYSHQNPPAYSENEPNSTQLYVGQSNLGSVQTKPDQYTGPSQYLRPDPYTGPAPLTGPAPFTGPKPFTGPSHFQGQLYAGQQFVQAYPPYGGQQPQQQALSTVVVSTQPTNTTFVTATVPDNMGLALFSCLCCFWPLGLVAIYKANECQNALARGDLESARVYSKDAKQFSLITIVCGIVLLSVLIGVFVGIVMA